MNISAPYIAVVHSTSLQNMIQIQLKSHVNIFLSSQTLANICGLSVGCISLGLALYWHSKLAFSQFQS